MTKKCSKGIKYNQWVEIYDKDKKLKASFKSRSNMCKKELDNYLVTMYNFGLTDLDYTIKILR